MSRFVSSTSTTHTHSQIQFAHCSIHNGHKTAELWCKPFAAVRSCNFFMLLFIWLFLSGLGSIWFKIKNSTLHSDAAVQTLFSHKLVIITLYLKSDCIPFIVRLIPCLPIEPASIHINVLCLHLLDCLIQCQECVVRSKWIFVEGAHCRRINRQSCFMLMIKKTLQRKKELATKLPSR